RVGTKCGGVPSTTRNSTPARRRTIPGRTFQISCGGPRHGATRQNYTLQVCATACTAKAAHVAPLATKSFFGKCQNLRDRLSHLQEKCARSLRAKSASGKLKHPTLGYFDILVSHTAGRDTRLHLLVNSYLTETEPHDLE